MEVDITVDVIGETCPIPLIETRKAIRKAKPNQIIEIIGTHKASRKEIPMAVENLEEEIVEVKDDDKGQWHIFIKKRGN